MIEIDMAPPGAERLVGTNPLVEETVARDIAFGEGPVWDKGNKQFFFTDICGDAGLGSLYLTTGDGSLYRSQDTGRCGLQR